MSELIQCINDPINYPLDTRWEDLPVELRVPPVSRVYVDANAASLELMCSLKRSDDNQVFATPRDALVGHLLAFTPNAECWVGTVQVGTQAELDKIHRYLDRYLDGPWAMSCADGEPDEPDASSEPLPDCPVCPEPAEPPQFWSDDEWKENIAEMAEIERELASEEWDRLHPEERCPPRE